MAHAHDHSHDDHAGYFTEQLCTIAVSAAYAGIMGVLCYAVFAARFGEDADQERTVLSIIAPWIQWMVLIGALILLALVILRAVAVWRLSKANPLAHHHHHDHDPEHAHGHSHAHDHDHDHGWSPMRYIPLVLPIVMFFLGLPNDRMIRMVDSDIFNRAGGAAVPTGLDPADIAGSFGIAALGEFGMNGVGGWQYALGAALSHAEEETVLPIDAYTDLDELERAAQSPASREHWKSLRRVSVEGMFNRVGETPNGFTIARIVRIRIACCLTDGRPAHVPALSRKRLDQFQERQWVSVQGKVDFHNVNGKWTPFLRAYQVKKVKEPANPYLK